jgi:hypothetical protein
MLMFALALSRFRKICQEYVISRHKEIITEGATALGFYSLGSSSSSSNSSNIYSNSVHAFQKQ